VTFFDTAEVYGPYANEVLVGEPGERRARGVQQGRSMPAEQEMSVEVHGLIANSFPLEYIEAVVEDALKILPAYGHRRDTLVVVNARRIAVILDKQERRGAVVPVDPIEQVVSGPVKERLQVYLTTRARVLRPAHRRQLVPARRRRQRPEVAGHRDRATRCVRDRPLPVSAFGVTVVAPLIPQAKAVRLRPALLLPSFND